MSRPVRALINTSALRRNARVVRQLADGRRIYAAIKANAYGHGAEIVARYLSKEIDGFAVIETDVAAHIRVSGFSGPILILEGFYEPGDIDRFAAFDLEAVVHSLEQVDWVCSYQGPLLKIWLKVDTGMNRLGLPAHQLSAVMNRIRFKKNIKICGVMSHLADIDDADSVKHQVECFEAIDLPFDLPRSLSSSGAVIKYPAAHFGWVRPGLMLYGAAPFSNSTGKDFGLHPVMTFCSRIISISDIKAGEAVGYGRTFIASQPMKIANVAGGYADGYPLSAATGTPIMVDGILARTIGRISMDKLSVDITNIPAAQVGTEVIFWGPTLPVETVAKAVNSSPYELLTQVSSRVLRELT